MESEQRRGRRIPLELELCLICHDGILHRAVATNLSPQGLYLQPSSLLIPRHHPAQINLRLAGRHFHIPAMVVHHADAGMGLMFNRAEYKLYLAACDLVTSSAHDDGNSYAHLPQIALSGS